MKMDHPTVALVDDDPGMLRALRRLLRLEGLQVRPFASAEDFLRRGEMGDVDCLVLDVALPGLSGLELQERLERDGVGVPIVFLTGQGDIPMAVRAMKAGAVSVLNKPVDEADLMDAVRQAIGMSRRQRSEAQDLQGLQVRFARLTTRDIEVLRHVIAGKLSKQIAADLGIGEQTVKVHRMRLMGKMGMTSVADLVRAADRLQILPVPGCSGGEGQS